MNNNFMFTPNFNPYADNTKFLKKTIKSRRCGLIALGIGAMLVCLVYAFIFAFSKAGGKTNLFETPNEKTVHALSFFAFEMRMIFFIVILAILCIGTINFVEHLKNKENPYLPCSLANVGTFFFISVLVYYAATFLLSFVQLGLVFFLGPYDTVDELIPELGKIFFLDTVLSVFFVLWSISGIIFCSSVRSTLKCAALSDKGSMFFIMMSVIIAAMNGICALVYNVNDFKAGIFYIFDGSTVLSDTINNSRAGITMFNIFFVLSILVCIAAVGFAVNYRTAVEAAQRSFSRFGSNLYMNGDSTAANYYQSFYTPPNANTSGMQPPAWNDTDTPPSPVRNHEFVRMDHNGDNTFFGDQGGQKP